MQIKRGAGIRSDMVEGYEAYLHGAKPGDCPYPENLPKDQIYLREGWMMGWDHGERESRDNEH
jgi:ribosome modulation factor